MKPPRIKGEPTKPVKIDRTKYQQQLSRPIDSSGTNMVADNPGAFTPEIMSANGYNLVSGSGKEAIYEKGGNYHLYNEQPNGVNKYGMVSIGNPNQQQQQPTALPALKPALAKADRKPLDLSNPNMTLDPNTGTYYNPSTGAQIEPIVERYKKGGPVKGYEGGGYVNHDVIGNSTATNGYSQNIANANAKKEAERQAKQNNAAQYSSAAGGLAMTIGNQMYTPPQDLVTSEREQKDTKTAKDTIDNTASSVTPWYGLAKGLSNIGKSQIKKDEYGYAKTTTGDIANDWLTPDHELIIDGYQRDGLKGALIESSGFGKVSRTAASVLGKEDSKKGFWGFTNRNNGTTENNKKREENIAAIDYAAGADQRAIDEASAQEARIKREGDWQRAIMERDLQGFSQGGQVKGPGTGKSDSIPAKVKTGSFVVPAENAPIAEEIREKVLNKPVKAAKLNQNGGTDIKISNGEHLFTPEEKQKIQMKGININALAPEADISGAYADGGDVKKKQTEHKYLKMRVQTDTATPAERAKYQKLSRELGGTGSSTNFTPKNTPKSAPKTSGVAAPKMKTESALPSDWSANWAKENPGSVPDQSAGDLAQTAVPSKKTAPTVNGVDPNQAAFDKDEQEALNRNNPDGTLKTAPQSGSKFNVGKLIDYGIPAIQTGLGLKYLKDAGKRPVDQLDPDYLRSIETAKGNVVTANANAKFGFSPEEQAAIDQQNAGLTKAGRYDARNFSGGSGANALNMERTVINDSFARGLAAKAQNRNLIFQKQAIANDRQQYADQLITGKVGMSNRLFNQKLEGWQQQQQTGQDLIASGLRNAIGSKMYQDELAASKDRANRYNVQYPTIA